MLIAPSTEVVDLLSAGISFDIPTIDSVAVSEFSLIRMDIDSVAMSGTQSLAYRGSNIDAFTSRTSHWFHQGLAATANQAIIDIHHLNTTDFPVMYETMEMSDVSNNGHKQHHGVFNGLVAVDAIQILLVGGTTPTMDSGTLRLMGMR